jgi:hypothetical protein
MQGKKINKKNSDNGKKKKKEDIWTKRSQLYLTDFRN